MVVLLLPWEMENPFLDGKGFHCVIYACFDRLSMNYLHMLRQAQYERMVDPVDSAHASTSSAWITYTCFDRLSMNG
jgi:hypothetical protein